MLKYIKKHKILFIIIIFTLLIFLLGILSTSLIDNKTKNTISNNIIAMINHIKNKKYFSLILLKNELIKNIFLITIIWLLGISIIGIPIIIFLYSLKILLFSYETFFLLINFKYISIPFFIIYLIPYIIEIIILFILVFFSSNYSIVLIKLLFQKKEYNIKLITKKYLLILLYINILSIINSLLRLLLIPKLLFYLI